MKLFRLLKIAAAPAVLAVSVLSTAPAYAQLAPPNKDGLTFGLMAANVKDIEWHKKFWVEQFEGVLIQKNGITAVKFPGMLLILNQAPSAGPSLGDSLDHFGFKVKNTAETSARLKAAGLDVQPPFTGAEGFPNAYATTTDGVRIELQEDATMKQNVIAYHMHFLTPDYVKLMDWYVQTFGLEPFKRGTIATTANAPGMNFSFQNARMPTVPTKGRAIDHIGFEIKNLEAYCKNLEAKGIKFDIPYHADAATGIKSAFLTDPDGTYIELTEGFDKY
jgi:catechol 2,3-dioxygenase-like lactoylglutathione lyase family enzyme